MAASGKFGRGFGVIKIKKILNSYPNIINYDINEILIEKINLIDGF